MTRSDWDLVLASSFVSLLAIAGMAYEALQGGWRLSLAAYAVPIGLGAAMFVIGGFGAIQQADGLRELREGTAQAGLEHFEKEKAQPERSPLDGGIEASRDGLREGRRVGLELEESLRLARDACGRVRGHVAPDIIHKRSIDGSHQEESPCDLVRSPVR